MKRQRGMTRRLLVYLTGITIFFWIAAVGIGAIVMKLEFNEIFDSALEETSRRLFPLTVEDYRRRESAHEPQRIDRGTEGEYIIYQLRDGDGRVLLSSHRSSTAPFPVPLKPGFSETATHRVFTQAADGNRLFLQTADPLYHRREAMLETAMALLIPILLLAPISVLAILVVVRQSLAPITTLGSEISARDGGNLTALPDMGLPYELQPIVDTVNHLMDRLRAALEGEREFSANSAHELRTPLAGAFAQIQRLVRELPKGHLHDRAMQVQSALARLTQLTEKLLELSRADSGIGLSSQAVDLLPVLKLVIEEFERKKANAGRIRLDMAGDARFVAQIDIDAFAIAFRNLLENALIHSPARTPVEIGVHPDGRLTVRNEGLPIPEAALPDLTKRFKRGATKAGGSGLGLAIAATLVRQMGGALALASPAPGQADGFEATVFLLRAGDVQA